LINEKFPIENKIDTSILLYFDKFVSGDTTSKIYMKLKKTSCGIWYTHDIYSNSFRYPLVYGNKSGINYIVSSWGDTTFLNGIKLKRFIAKGSEPTITTKSCKQYQIKCIYKALSKGGDLKIYITNFDVFYFDNKFIVLPID